MVQAQYPSPQNEPGAAASYACKEDSWGPLDPKDSLDASKHAVVALSVINVIYQCCMEGKALIPM